MLMSTNEMAVTMSMTLGDFYRHAIREAESIKSPDEAYRIWCPNCGFVLGEHFIGVGRYLCRNCRWEGAIIRIPTTLVQSYQTYRRGRETTHIAQRMQSGSNGGQLANKW